MTDTKIIAIDGPAGSGKSTVAKAVAARLGLPHLDTGAMYRAVAFAALRRDVDLSAPDALAALARELDIEVAGRVLVDGEDATEAIRGAAVTKAVSAVAAAAPVRAELVRRQQAWAQEQGGGVVEGRDIGTVVFPQAHLKVYLIAEESERLRRRALELGDEVANDISRRDQADAQRVASPMVAAPDAVVIDTTDRTIGDIVEEVLSKL
ncbi:MAG: (d)CMP kinase [Actinomycetota bacterium]|nr:(d)CMP kinase [Actinomycetota bacterium]